MSTLTAPTMVQAALPLSPVEQAVQAAQASRLEIIRAWIVKTFGKVVASIRYYAAKGGEWLSRMLAYVPKDVLTILGTMTLATKAGFRKALDIGGWLVRKAGSVLGWLVGKADELLTRGLHKVADIVGMFNASAGRTVTRWVNDFTMKRHEALLWIHDKAVRTYTTIATALRNERTMGAGMLAAGISTAAIALKMLMPTSLVTMQSVPVVGSLLVKLALGGIFPFLVIGAVTAAAGAFSILQDMRSSTTDTVPATVTTPDGTKVAVPTAEQVVAATSAAPTPAQMREMSRKAQSDADRAANEARRASGGHR